MDKLWVIEHFSENNGLHHLADVVRSNGQKLKFIDLTKGDEFTYPKQKDNIIFFGSQEMGASLIDKGFTGDIHVGDDKFFAENIQGCPYALNQGIKTTLKDLSSDLDNILAKGDIFIRPNSYIKYFSGQVISKDNRDKAWDNITFYLDNLDIDIIYSPIKVILEEYRCLLINNKLISACRYENSKGVEEVCIQEFEKFISQFKTYWPGAFATIDLAKTNEGLKLIEFNPLSTSAIYKNNPQKIFKAFS